MSIEFTPARREQIKARVALIGPPGSGKTLGALNIARALGGKIYGVDTEHGRMKLYADQFEFEHGNLTDQRPEGYVEALRIAVQHDADVVVFDSASHEWLAILTEADRFANWKDLTPRHNDFIQALAAAPVHVIVTMRAKVKYDVSEVEEGGRKKQKIERIGIGPVQRENVEYEFDVIGYLDGEHQATFLNRCDALVGKTMEIPEAIPILVDWLEHGEPDPAMQRATPAEVEGLRSLLIAEGQEAAVIEDAFRKLALRTGGVLTRGLVEEKVAAAMDRARKKAEAKDAPKDAPKPAAAAGGKPTWEAVGDALVQQVDAPFRATFGAFVAELGRFVFGKGKVPDGFDPFDPEQRGKAKLNAGQQGSLLAAADFAAAAVLAEPTLDDSAPGRQALQAAFKEAAKSVLGADVDLEGPGWALGPDEADRPQQAGPAAQEPAGEPAAASGGGDDIPFG